MKILNIGSINIDKSYHVENFTEPGKTISSLSFNQSVGGKGLNQSIAMARAGVTVWHAGCVGKDGDELIDLMQSDGIHLEYLEKSDGLTGHAIIQINKKGQNSIMIHSGSNNLVNCEYIDRVLGEFENGDFLVLQKEIPNIDYAICRAREKGMVVFLNPSPIEHINDIENIDKVDYIILNEVEGRILSDKESYIEILDALKDKYVRAAIVLTIGKNGVLYRDHTYALSHASYNVDVVDTTAAGDTFTGYFIASVSRGESAEKALEDASLAASICTSRFGAAVSIPHRREVMDFRKTAQKS